MKALIFDGAAARVVPDRPVPACRPGWAVLRVLKAGICRTDLEITRGYMNFTGVLGHEFVGIVEDAGKREWIGRRVVGEINAACGTCSWCRQGLGRHCPTRTTLGIAGLDGCMAEYCTLPIENLHAVPDDVSDDSATFVEPLSAACEILRQVDVQDNRRCIVLGDGKLGILCAWVLSSICEDVTLVGRHPDKLGLASWSRLKTALSGTPGADIVVEATGRPEGLIDAMNLCRPRGTLVLKSTIASQGELNLAPIVVNEITVIGSRCGLFADGLRAITGNRFPLERLVAARYPLDRAAEALQHAARPGVLKVLLDVDSTGPHRRQQTSRDPSPGAS